MMKLIVAVFFLAALAGCHIHSHHGTWHGDDYVVIESGHVHSVDCGHYYHHGRWYHRPGHHHGPGCGHVHRDGIWIVIE